MENRSVDLTKYATQYDNMARFKPSYHQVQQEAIKCIQAYCHNATEVLIQDAGAGTGELSKRLSQTFREAKIYAVELNPGFFEILSKKVKELENVEIVNGNIESRLFPDNHFDAIAMIHVLNYTENAKDGLAITRAYEQLKPGGVLVIADIGRSLNLKLHLKETLSAAYKELGVFRTIWLYLNSLQVIHQNRSFVKNQEVGIHPMHSLEELCNLISSFGFQIIEKRDDLYLGDDDFVVAQKPI